MPQQHHQNPSNNLKRPPSASDPNNYGANNLSSITIILHNNASATNNNPTAITTIKGHIIAATNFTTIGLCALIHCYTSQITEHGTQAPPFSGLRQEHLRSYSPLRSRYKKAQLLGKTVAAVFLDLTAAFDKLWNEHAIQILYELGIEGTMLKWIAAFLTTRKIKNPSHKINIYSPIKREDRAYTRLRLRVSRLHGDYYKPVNCPQCNIPNTFEHLFFVCPAYTVQRIELCGGILAAYKTTCNIDRNLLLMPPKEIAPQVRPHVFKFLRDTGYLDKL
ncbi:hypothetical protein DPMN_193715 [Dreissena polymorpha]|uniref:Reverse transcriptase domain-containing protein n=1 Tax=Dreissena polymorpha TaxID=45954 RepID=A0A9D4BCB3_DREPO|nr:hypothetical protein DPMN_193715 [Dreissena polymorpha]